MITSILDQPTARSLFAVIARRQQINTWTSCYEENSDSQSLFRCMRRTAKNDY